MNTSFARNAFVIVVMVTFSATAFRVFTAPQRIKERRDTARSVCVGSGGEWVTLSGDELCQRNDEPKPDQPKKI